MKGIASSSLVTRSMPQTQALVRFLWANRRVGCHSCPYLTLGKKVSAVGAPYFSGRGPQRCPAMRRLNSFRHVLAARCWTASVVTEGFKMTLNCSSSFLFRVRVNVTAHVCNYEVFGHITSSHFVCSHLTQSSVVTLGCKTTPSYLAGVFFRVRVNTTFHVHSYEVFGHL